MYRVLIADDSTAYLEWLRFLFEDSPEFEVVGAAQSGAAALQVVAEQQPDLVLADVEMPEMDGIDLARTLAGERPDIDVILISSSDEPYYHQAARESQALAFLAKADLSLAALQEILQKAGPQ